MKKILFLALFIVVSCSKEPSTLERCIEANSSYENNYREKGDNYEWSSNLSPEEDLKKFAEQLNPVELYVHQCEGEVYKLSETDEYRTLYETNEEEYFNVMGSMYDECRKPLKPEQIRDIAIKVCHSQGIY